MPVRRLVNDRQSATVHKVRAIRFELEARNSSVESRSVQQVGCCWRARVHQSNSG